MYSNTTTHAARLLGWLTAALIAAAPAAAQPTIEEDLGTLANGATVVRTGHVAANEAPHWYRFTIPAVPAGSGAGHYYLDIRTTNPVSNTSFISSSIGLYDAAGNFATGVSASSVDRTQGPSFFGLNSGGALSYGATCPTRPNTATAPATTNGATCDGRDGPLPAGTYYIAFMRDGGTYNNGWLVTPVTVGSTSGIVQLEITLGTTGNPPPLLTASAATPPAINPGGTTLLTVTTGTCTTGDAPTSMTVNLASVGGSALATMYNDGSHGDVTAGDSVWSLSTAISAAPGSHTLPATATNAFGVSASRDITVVIHAGPAPVRISQINATGATQHSWAGPSAEYVEVHNTGAVAVDLSGWAIQNTTTATGATWVVRPFPAGFTVPAHGYALMQLAPANTPLNSPNNPDDIYGFVPAADVVVNGGAISSLGGKVALTSTQAALTGGCPTADPHVIDFVGYGGADCSNGSPAPQMSNFDGRSIYRGCDGNASDFALDFSSPRNRLSPPDLGAMTAVGTPTMATAPSVVQHSTVLLTASASSCSGAPSGVQFTANLSFVGGSGSQPMYDDGTHGDDTAGDGTFSLSYTVPNSLLPAPPPGPTINRPYVVPMTATDSLGRSATTYGAFYVTAAPTGACCIPGQSVAVRTQAACIAAGGTYRGDNSSPFAATGALYPSSANGGTVPSLGSLSIPIEVPDPVIVNDLVVVVVGDHTYLGDVTCTLTKGTTTVTLFQRVGVAGNNATGRPGNIIFPVEYRFVDGGASFWNAAYSGGKDDNYPEPSGFYAPSGAANAPSSLAPFIGASAQGTWTVTFSDAALENTGVLYAQIEINPTLACRCPADYDGNGSIEPADIAAFVNAWFTSLQQGTLAGDYDHNGFIEPADIAAFVNAWFTALGTGC